ncbi:hypothetical protein SteCoe_298 [Stentor coeruleus]|uniref:Uncharacterized protein n=1 Tax=Stentor coeruleus TaxID=5963 RepID=A0A1R2D4H9_9CILI|nr:hypothetical protein SteCoe_298 [Stentor coeruleus]
MNKIFSLGHSDMSKTSVSNTSQLLHVCNYPLLPKPTENVIENTSNKPFTLDVLKSMKESLRVASENIISSSKEILKTIKQNTNKDLSLISELSLYFQTKIHQNQPINEFSLNDIKNKIKDTKPYFKDPFNNFLLKAKEIIIKNSSNSSNTQTTTPENISIPDKSLFSSKFDPDSPDSLQSCSTVSLPNRSTIKPVSIIIPPLPYKNIPLPEVSVSNWFINKPKPINTNIIIPNIKKDDDFDLNPSSPITQPKTTQKYEIFFIRSQQGKVCMIPGFAAKQIVNAKNKGLSEVKIFNTEKNSYTNYVDLKKMRYYWIDYDGKIQPYYYILFQDYENFY